MLHRKPPWHLEFASRAGRHHDVDVQAPTNLSLRERRDLADSLATFQIGESGTGEHLLAAANEAETTTRYQDALAMFVAEEQEHARLLALVLEAIDRPLRTSHWTDQVFVFLRQIKSLRSEVLTLLVAELVALSYYGALRDGVPDYSHVFARIHDDEVRHIDFHADTLPKHIRTWPKLVQVTVRLLWNLLVTGSSVVVALDHRRALNIAGMSPLRFIRSVQGDLRDLDKRLFASPS